MTTTTSRSLPSVVVERASLQKEVLRVFERAVEQGSVIEEAGSAACEVAGSEAFSDASPEELERRAVRLRAAALQALVAAGELVACAGRLQHAGYVLSAVVDEVDSGMMRG